jgi:hypothetical protein
MTELSYQEFRERAAHISGLDPELYEQLFPMVRDLLRMAQRINELAPELHGDVPEARLSHDALGLT